MKLFPIKNKSVALILLFFPPTFSIIWGMYQIIDRHLLDETVMFFICILIGVAWGAWVTYTIWNMYHIKKMKELLKELEKLNIDWKNVSLNAIKDVFKISSN